jgi:hypothetical protein
MPVPVPLKNRQTIGVNGVIKWWAVDSLQALGVRPESSGEEEAK